MRLRSFVQRISKEQGAFVPDFDPNGPRAEARILLLLQDPGAEGAARSGILSPWAHEDRTAINNRNFISQAAIRREDCLFWNAIPWVINPGGVRGRQPKVAEKNQGAAYLHDLLEVLPRLCVILAQGGVAHDTCQRAQPLGVPVVETPHPGDLAANQYKNKPGGWERYYIDPMHRAAELAQGAPTA